MTLLAEMDVVKNLLDTRRVNVYNTQIYMYLYIYKFIVIYL